MWCFGDIIVHLLMKCDACEEHNFVQMFSRLMNLIK